MEESIYTQTVFEAFKKKFPQGWIDELDWVPQSQIASYREGVKRIQAFELYIFINYSKLVLSADYFIHTTATISQLEAVAITDDIVIEGCDYKKELQQRFVRLCDEIRRAFNKMLKYHICVAENQFRPHSKGVIINVLTDSFDGLPSLFKLICDCCWLEFGFSYNEDYIMRLIFKLENLKYVSSKQSGEVKEIVDATIEKVSILLGKLSAFSKNKELAYRFDLQDYSISLTSLSQLNQEDFRSYLQKFIDVNQITKEEIYEWQQEAHQARASLWKFIFLMRYYVKKTKSKQQIDNLINEFERHNNESLRRKLNLVDKYACFLAQNYMYNSRFSFLCKDESGDYSYESMKDDLEQIDAIQNETMILNYHPYQKAIEFLIKKLPNIINNSKDIKKAEEYLDFLKKCFAQFKNNVGWCKEHQPYYIQSHYSFSTIKVGDIDVFCPSSFCRPLKFKEIDEKAVQFRNDIAFLNYQVEHMDDRVEWQDAKDKVERLERKNLETMGLFVTITTFLVGMLAIFIGNDEKVSIFNKLEYTSVLGMVLMLFVCLGYFVVTDNVRKPRSLFFGIFAVLLLLAIILAYSRPLFGI